MQESTSSPPNDNHNKDDNEATPTIAEDLNSRMMLVSSSPRTTEKSNHSAGAGAADDDNAIDEISDLSNLQRKIFVVTTACLPWRTGTAVNPFLRALYLTRGRPKHYVTLVIPWLEDEDARKKLYGQPCFNNQNEQEEWIRTYARERANCSKEEQAMNILFYPAVYHQVFGSIFPSIDICSLVDEKDADVAILEEPEHLNWFRVPTQTLEPSSSSSTTTTSPTTDSATPEKETEVEGGICTGTSDSEALAAAGAKEEPTTLMEMCVKSDVVDDDDDNDKEEDSSKKNENESITPKTGSCSDLEALHNKQKDIEELGWAHKFRFVVGILHTNYSAYMKQYGIGTSLIGAPAITVLSSIVVNAYCHKVIRLSAVLPSLVAEREITCNVHGVRGEFLYGVKINDDEEDVAVKTVVEGKDGEEEEQKKEVHAAVYFIGKIMWAKGFDKLLQIQDKFRKKTGHYFPMDVYGAGPEEKAITRAFHGRGGPQEKERCESQGSTNTEPSLTSTDARAATIFNDPIPLRERIFSVQPDDFDEHEGIEVARDDIDSLQLVNRNDHIVEYEGQTNPLDIIGDVSKVSITTATLTSQAVFKLADSLVCHGLFMMDDDEEGGGDEILSKASSFIFDPPQSLHEWRRQAIPARFLGVKDHALLRDIKEHKIFLNASITEVLCTTTNEALAMGKFVIIPRHPSNDFFLQFPNCLAYETLKDCVAKLQFALENEPEPLSEKHIHELAWEGAIERLYEVSKLTKKQVKENSPNASIARLHVEFGKKGHTFGKFLSSI
eukprot:CAMPEP_0195283372 /NCGR_PEP_ID=MMETSP0707-20130614/1943_1 /TAXON_ID=33640 /ORGANISM="Asterionellopsis glacialis, Strain CCMP134" /LENGTH=779 /DNA_ID=CAMNT_0040342531 /DNA_START=56 /DNA_END=2395 /DNA_ORIENTATION=+